MGACKECLGKATNALSHILVLHCHVSYFRGEKSRKDLNAVAQRVQGLTAAVPFITASGWARPSKGLSARPITLTHSSLSFIALAESACLQKAAS